MKSLDWVTWLEVKVEADNTNHEDYLPGKDIIEGLPSSNILTAYLDGKKITITKK